MAHGDPGQNQRIGADPAIAADHHVATGTAVVGDMGQVVDEGGKGIGGHPIQAVQAAEQDAYPFGDGGVAPQAQGGAFLEIEHPRRAIGTGTDLVVGQLAP